ncbi:MAG: hypothetical protein P8008_01635, partial [Gammaproteobacteria bacterium]
MTLLLLAIIALTLMVMSYNRVPLLVCVGILAGITIVLTEIREIYYTPSWFRWTYGVMTVVLLGFAIRPLRRLLIS